MIRMKDSEPVECVHDENLIHHETRRPTVGRKGREREREEEDIRGFPV